ncbi:MAG: histone deacetylase family protein [Candidatus Aramenus sp.]|nr:histone deacetylase family protein [Candidatus Aramenus sp.]
MEVAVIWDDRFGEISFSHPMIRDVAKARIRKFYELVKGEDYVIFVRPEPAPREALTMVHTREYLEKLERASQEPHIGFLDSGDTVHYPGMMGDILLVVGASLTAVKLSKFFDRIYIPLGGFHHAFPDRAMGFCPVNDIAIAVKLLEEKGRVAIIDVDAHHGNGLQHLFYDRPVLKVNVFAYDGKFFPGTGHYSERGVGEGRGLNFNVTLPLGSGDDAFQEALKVLDVVYDFKPDYLVVLAGVDGHKDDGLKSLNLTSNSYNLLGYKVSRLAKELGAKVVSYGGGGYGEYSAYCMLEFVRGLKGIRERTEPETEDKEKREYVRSIVSYLLSEGLPSSLK